MGGAIQDFYYRDGAGHYGRPTILAKKKGCYQGEKGDEDDIGNQESRRAHGKDRE